MQALFGDICIYIYIYIFYGLRPLPPAPIERLIFSEIMRLYLRYATEWGGTMVFFHFGVGAWRGITIAFLGAVLDPNTCILGTLGGHFGTFGLILVTRGRPGSSKRHPLEPEEVFNRFLTDFRSLLGTSLGSFWWLFRICWCQSGRLGCGPLLLLFSVWRSNPRA